MRLRNQTLSAIRPALVGLLVGTTLSLGACQASIDGGTGPGPDSSDGGNDAWATPGQCPGGDAAFAALMTQVQAAVDAAQAPGLALAIVCGGKLAHADAVGRSKIGGEELSAETRFQLASMTKMFSAAAAARLASQGAVDLDAPISEYMPNLAFGHISLRQLLSHSAGFPTEYDSNEGTDLVGTINANASMAMWAPPGQVWNYSNIGFAVAGAVLETATGRPFGSIVEEEVFATVNMSSASMSSAAVESGGSYAFGHAGGPSAPTVYGPDSLYYDWYDYGPMGGAWGSVTDMARWAEAHMSSEDPLGSGLMRSLRQKQIRTSSATQGYGLGHFIEDSDPLMVHHGGSVTGFLADFSSFPEEGFAVVVLSNSDWLSPAEISRLAIDTYIGDVDFAEAPTASPEQLVGTYNDANIFGQVVIREAGQGLEAQFVDQGFTSPLVPYWGDSYGVNYGADGEIDFNFWREPGQDASHIVSLYGVAKRE